MSWVGAKRPKKEFTLKNSRKQDKLTSPPTRASYCFMDYQSGGEYPFHFSRPPHLSSPSLECFKITLSPRDLLFNSPLPPVHHRKAHYKFSPETSIPMDQLVLNHHPPSLSLLLQPSRKVLFAPCCCDVALAYRIIKKASAKLISWSLFAS